MTVPVRIWTIAEGTARGLRLDVGETVEFDLAPGDMFVLSPQQGAGRAGPVLIDASRLRESSPRWGGPGAA